MEPNRLACFWQDELINGYVEGSPVELWEFFHRCVFDAQSAGIC